MQDSFSQERRLVKTSTPGIYKRGSRYVVIFRDPHGRQRKRSARTLAEARELKATLTADVRRGEYRALSKVSFADYLPLWLNTYGGRTRRGVREHTLGDYRKALESEALPFFGRMPLAAIEPRDVKQFAERLASRGLAANTVRNKIAPLKALLATAVEEGLIRSNPTAGLRLVGVSEVYDDTDDTDAENVKALTEAELQAILAEISAEWKPIIEFLTHTGLRIGEAVALQWRDVDFGLRRVKVRRRLYRGKLDKPKSRYGRRDVPLSEGLARKLWEQRKQATGLGRGDDGRPIFPSKVGTPLTPSNVFRAFKPAARRAGVPWAGLHTLRHTCATILFRNGFNAKQVQLWLGHHSPAFTLTTYVHLLPDDLPDASFLDRLTAQLEEPLLSESGAGQRAPNVTTIAS